MGNSTLISLTCPQCHAQLEINSTELQVNCQHCGTQILVRDFITARRIDNQDKQTAFQALAENAFKNKDWARAFEYYEKLCKISPTADNLRNMNISSLFSGKVQIQQSTLNSLYELPIEQHREILSELLKHLNTLKSKELATANTIANDNRKKNAVNSIHTKYAPALQALYAETNKLKPISCSCGGQLQYNEDVCSRCGKAKQVILKEQNDKKNKQTLIIVAVCVILVLIVAIFAPRSSSENNNNQVNTTTTAVTTETTASTLVEPTEHGTSQYVDYIYYKAKEDAKTATDDDLQKALTWLKDNTESYFSNQEYMELTMYYGELLEMKYKDTGNEYEKIGWQAYKTIKYVYRGAESVSDEVTQNNLSELKEMVSAAKNIK